MIDSTSCEKLVNAEFICPRLRRGLNSQNVRHVLNFAVWGGSSAPFRLGPCHP